MTGDFVNKRVGVMQLSDTLLVGGLERVAVNLANRLPQESYLSYLCATRGGGPLGRFVEPHVRTRILDRTGRFDAGAIRRLSGCIRENDIGILHAHGTSLFMAAIVGLLNPRLAVVWHDHFGRYATEERPVWLYRLAAARVDGVIAVNTFLAEWARCRLGVRGDRVWYVPNFVCAQTGETLPATLPGIDGKRIVCVANNRPEKDHPTLIRAMKLVLDRMPEAHLILVGNRCGPDRIARMEDLARKLGIAGSITWLGERNDVPDILSGCDIGVLSSASEGLPLALIEYGMAGLASVATEVGQCGEVLDDGKAGILVAPSNPAELAEAIVRLLADKMARAEYGGRLRGRVLALYDSRAAMRRICAIYEMVMGGSKEVEAR